ncbi:hypothetical protein [Streptomyces sp. NPDC001068]|uniref:hypothetical protein n=1 Tax=Streptomyces sp. NPDC001068 TaxID=3364544 RepID=UPI0036993F7D
MGIRMLHGRTPRTRPPAKARPAAAQVREASPAPAMAPDAGSARIPTDLTVTVRTAVTRLRRGLRGRPDPRQRLELVRSYLALVLSALPGPRRPRTMTVFVATLTERPRGSGAHHRPPEPDARP